MLQGKRLFAGPDGRLGATGTLSAGLMAGFTEGLLLVTPMGEQLSPSRFIALSHYIHYLALKMSHFRIGSLWLASYCPSLDFCRYFCSHSHHTTWHQEIRSWWHSICGALTPAVWCLEVLKTRMQADANSGTQRKYQGSTAFWFCGSPIVQGCHKADASAAG